MKVILLQNVRDLGEKGEVKEVALGYARNFLIPHGLVREATDDAVREIEAQKAKVSKEAELDLQKTESLAQKLDGQIIEVTAKASEEGTLYAAISAAKVVSALKSKGFEVRKEQLLLGHIKELGEHELVVNLDHGLEARITLVINPE